MVAKKKTDTELLAELPPAGAPQSSSLASPQEIVGTTPSRGGMARRLPSTTPAGTWVGLAHRKSLLDRARATSIGPREPRHLRGVHGAQTGQPAVAQLEMAIKEARKLTAEQLNTIVAEAGRNAVGPLARANVTPAEIQAMEKRTRAGATEELAGQQPITSTIAARSLELLAAPSDLEMALVKTIGDTLRSGEKKTPGALRETMLENVHEGTSAMSAARSLAGGRLPTMVEAHPFVAEFGLRALTDPANLVIPAVAGAVGRGLKAGTQTARGLGAVERLTDSLIESHEAGRIVEGAASEIFEREATIRGLHEVVGARLGALADVVADSAGPTRTEIYIAPAQAQELRGGLRAAGKVERQARQIGGRIKREARIPKPRLPDAGEPLPGVAEDARAGDLRTVRVELRDAQQELRQHDATFVRENLEAKKGADRAAQDLAAAAELRSRVKAIKESPTYLELATKPDKSGQVPGSIRLGQLEAKIANFEEHAADLEEAGQAVAPDALKAYQDSLEAWALKREELSLAVKDVQGRIDEIGGSLAEQKGRQAIPLSVGRAQPILGRFQGRTLLARQRLNALTEQRSLEGYTPISKKGLAIDLPIAVEEGVPLAGPVSGGPSGVLLRRQEGVVLTRPRGATPRGGSEVSIYPTGPANRTHVASLIGAYAEGVSPLGLARTPVEAKAEIDSIARALGLDTGEIHRAALQARGVGQVYRKALIEARLITQEEADEMAKTGGYVRRSYLRYEDEIDHYIATLRADGKDEMADRLESQYRGRVKVEPQGRAAAKPSELTERQNIPIEGRLAQGEITDVEARLRIQGGVVGRNLSRMEQFQSLAQNPDLVSEGWKPGWVRIPGPEDALKRAERAEMQNQPSIAHEIREQVFSGAWGELTGKWVHPRLYGSLIPTDLSMSNALKAIPSVVEYTVAVARFGKDSPQAQAALSGPAKRFLWDVETQLSPVIEKSPPGRSWFGIGKAVNTIFSWKGQIANIISNVSAMQLVGEIPGVKVIGQWFKGLQHLRTDSPLYQQVLKLAPDLRLQGSRQELRQVLDYADATMRGAKLGQNAFQKTVGVFGTTWTGNEIVAKMGVIDYWVGKGMPLEQALAKAEKAIINYRQVNRFTENLRAGRMGVMSYLIPFPTYGLRMSQALARVAITKPSRLNMYTWARRASWEAVPEEQRKVEQEMTPGYERSNLLARWPSNDKYGRPLLWRTARITPMGGVDFAQSLAGRAPFLVGPAYDAWRNQDEYGNPIGDPLDRLAYFLEKATPQVGEASRMAEAAKGPDYHRGKLPPTTGTVALRQAAISLYPLDMSKEMQRRSYALQDNEKVFNRELGELVEKYGDEFEEWPAGKARWAVENFLKYQVLWEELEAQARRAEKYQVTEEDLAEGKTVGVGGHARKPPQQKVATE